MKPNISEETQDNPVPKNFKVKYHHTILELTHIKKNNKNNFV